MSDPLRTGSQWSAILATGRVSNLPTVASNCLVAMLIALAGTAGIDHGSPAVLLSIIFGACQLYIGGCFLGDAIDVEFDQKNKPERPIPTGMLSRRSIYTWAWLLLISGTFTPLLLIGWHQGISLNLAELLRLAPIFFLPASIILYSIYHKRSAWLGLPLIGLCRFFLIAYSSTLSLWACGQTTLLSSSVLIFYGLPVAIYTICFASVARTESSPSPVSSRKLLGCTMFLLPIFAEAFPHKNDLVIIALASYWIWLQRGFKILKHDKGGYVAVCLAGFSLLDACFVCWIGVPWLLLCLTLFLLALILQRWAPAT